jgi:molecular chaperone HtpG
MTYRIPCARSTFARKELSNTTPCLHIPSAAPYDLYHFGANKGLRLFAKRVMIMDNCEDLLPDYLRFVRGIVDATDLPLNISRQRFQDPYHQDPRFINRDVREGEGSVPQCVEGIRACHKGGRIFRL